MKHLWTRRVTIALFGPGHGIARFLRKRFGHAAFVLADRSYGRRSGDGRAASPREGLPRVRGEWPPRGSRSLVLLAVADASYFRRYAPLLAASVSKNSPRTALHLHIVGETPEALDLAADLARRFPSLDYSYTWEPRDFSGWHPKEIARFCQCVRFLRAAELLDAADRPILTIDVDGVVLREISTAGQIPGDADVGLILRPQFSDPGKLVLAAAVYLAPTEAGRRFIETAFTRMRRHLFGPAFTPKLDQRCLALTYRALAEGTRVFPLSERFASTTPDDAVIFSAKGNLKRGPIFELWNELGQDPAAVK